MKKKYSQFINFTLIELLLVISIIAILASILLPALKSVREKSISIKCMANLKQTGTMFAFYAGDNNGWTLCMYMINTELGIYRTWPQNLQLYGYVNTQKNDADSVFVCPAQFPYFYKSANTDQAYGLSRPDDGYCYYQLYGTKPRYNLISGGTSHYHTFNLPSSQMVLLGDSRGAATVSQSYYLDMGSPGNPNLRRIHTRHKTLANLIFGDLHVDSVSGNALGGYGVKAYISQKGLFQLSE